MSDWIDIKTLLIIGHLLGVALGAGGAYMSDFIFLSSIKDRYFTKREIEFMTLGSRVVWAGVALLVLSGAGLFSLSPDYYLASSRFLAKMTIVLIIILNGVVFHYLHFPHIRRHSEQYLHREHLFHRKSIPLFVSGAISGVSWTSALILGALRTVPASYLTIMGVYLVVVTMAIAGSLTMRTLHIKLANLV